MMRLGAGSFVLCLLGSMSCGPTEGLVVLEGDDQRPSELEMFRMLKLPK